MSQQRTFIKSILMVAAILVAAVFALYMSGKIITVGLLPVMLSMVVAFGLITVLLYQNILRSTEKSPKRFVSAFIGAVSIKIFACALFLGIYFYLKGEGKLIVATGTMAVYLVFNVLFVKHLMHAMRGTDDRNN